MSSLRHLVCRTLSRPPCTRPLSRHVATQPDPASLHQTPSPQLQTPSPQLQTPSPQLLHNPKPRDVLPVPAVEEEDAPGKGEHYTRSYRQFTSWLNTGGTAEVFEGCLVVGRVIQVIDKASLDRPTLRPLQDRLGKLLRRRSFTRRFDQAATKLEETIAILESKIQSITDAPVDSSKLSEDTSAVLVIDWGHKHLGYAPLDYLTPCPRHGDYVTCRLLEMEVVHLPMGHETYERHNEARLEFIRTLETQVSDSPSRPSASSEEEHVECPVQQQETTDILTSDDIGRNGFVHILPYEHIFVRNEDKYVDLQSTLSLDIFVDNKFTGLVVGKKLSHLKHIRNELGVGVRCEFDDDKISDGKRCFTLSVLLAVRRIDGRIASVSKETTISENGKQSGDSEKDDV